MLVLESPSRNRTSPAGRVRICGNMQADGSASGLTRKFPSIIPLAPVLVAGALDKAALGTIEHWPISKAEITPDCSNRSFARTKQSSARALRYLKPVVGRVFRDQSASGASRISSADARKLAPSDKTISSGTLGNTRGRLAQLNFTACRRSHELRADGTGNRVSQDAVDLRLVGSIERPTGYFGCRPQLVGITGAPQRRGDTLVECPANGQVDDSFSKTVLGQLIQAVHGGEILSKAGLLKLRVGPSQVVASEDRVGSHSSRQQPTAEGPIAERRGAVLRAIRQDIGLERTFEKLIGRLHNVQRRNAAELLHLRNRVIADADRADLALLVERQHCLCGLIDRDQRLGPMHLIDVDVVGPQPAQRVLALAHDSLAARIAKNLTVTPFQPDLGGDDRARAQTCPRDCLADNFFGATETINGCGIDESNAVFDRGSDRRD